MQFRWAVLVSIAALSGCSPSADISLAEKQIPHFHELLDAGQFREIYASSSQEMKESGSENDFVALLEAVHRKLGTSKSSEEANWNINVHTSGTFVTLVYSTTYAEGKASERFTYRITGKQALLAGYHISSNALILK